MVVLGVNYFGGLVFLCLYAGLHLDCQVLKFLFHGLVSNALFQGFVELVEALVPKEKFLSVLELLDCKVIQRDRLLLLRFLLLVGDLRMQRIHKRKFIVQDQVNLVEEICDELALNPVGRLFSDLLRWVVDLGIYCHTRAVPDSFIRNVVVLLVVAVQFHPLKLLLKLCLIEDVQVGLFFAVVFHLEPVSENVLFEFEDAFQLLDVLHLQHGVFNAPINQPVVNAPVLALDLVPFLFRLAVQSTASRSPKHEGRGLHVKGLVPE